MILPIVDFTVPATLRRPSAESKAKSGEINRVVTAFRLPLSAFPFPVSTFRKGIRP